MFTRCNHSDGVVFMSDFILWILGCVFGFIIGLVFAWEFWGRNRRGGSNEIRC
jgi:hypothetical protein